MALQAITLTNDSGGVFTPTNLSHDNDTDTWDLVEFNSDVYYDPWNYADIIWGMGGTKWLKKIRIRYSYDDDLSDSFMLSIYFAAKGETNPDYWNGVSTLWPVGAGNSPNQAPGLTYTNDFSVEFDHPIEADKVSLRFWSAASDTDIDIRIREVEAWYDDTYPAAIKGLLKIPLVNHAVGGSPYADVAFTDAGHDDDITTMDYIEVTGEEVYAYATDFPSTRKLKRLQFKGYWTQAQGPGPDNAPGYMDISYITPGDVQVPITTIVSDVSTSWPYIKVNILLDDAVDAKCLYFEPYMVGDFTYPDFVFGMVECEAWEEREWTPQAIPVIT